VGCRMGRLVIGWMMRPNEECQRVERPQFETSEWLAGRLREGGCGLQSRESGMSVTRVGWDRANSTVGSILVGVVVKRAVIDPVMHMKSESGYPTVSGRSDWRRTSGRWLPSDPEATPARAGRLGGSSVAASVAIRQRVLQTVEYYSFHSF